VRSAWEVPRQPSRWLGSLGGFVWGIIVGIGDALAKGKACASPMLLCSLAVQWVGCASGSASGTFAQTSLHRPSTIPVTRPITAGNTVLKGNRMIPKLPQAAVHHMEARARMDRAISI